MGSTIFISYRHQDCQYREELVPAPAAVASIREQVWVDQDGIDVGDSFHTRIQEALADSGIAILLVSNDFLTSSYITQHELPFVLRQFERKALKLGMLYVSTVARGAFSVTATIDRSERTVDLADTLGINRPDKPLDLLKDKGDRNLLYKLTAGKVHHQQQAVANPVRPRRRPALPCNRASRVRRRAPARARPRRALRGRRIPPRRQRGPARRWLGLPLARAIDRAMQEPAVLPADDWWSRGCSVS